MKPYQKDKSNIAWVIIAFFVTALALYFTFSTSYMDKHKCYSTMISAANKMIEASEIVKAHRISKGIPISQGDINSTGLIGEELSDITTTLGNLQAKRTATNPDFAALTVKYFHELGLTEGSKVAIGASGSFPGIILSVLSACWATGVEPVIIASLGSSEYGGNIPGITAVEIIDALKAAGLFRFSPAAISLGGPEDTGRVGVLVDGRPILLNIAKKSGYPLLLPKSVPESISERLSIYRSAGEIEAFINIGGAEPNYGSTRASLDFPNGLVTSPPCKIDLPDMGLIYEFINMGIPVIHFLDLRGLATKSGIPVDPIPLPKPGTSLVYYERKFHKAYAASGLILAISLLFGPPILKYRKK